MSSMRWSATCAHSAVSGSTVMRLTTLPVDQVLEHPGAGAAASMRNIVEHGQMSGSSDTIVLSGRLVARRCTRWISVPTRDGRPGRGRLDGLDDVVGRPDLVGERAHLVRALGVGDDDAVRVLGAERLDVLGPEALVHRAVALPQQERRLLAVGAR